MILVPKVRHPRVVTIRRGGYLTDDDHHLLALCCGRLTAPSTYSTCSTRLRLAKSLLTGTATGSAARRQGFGRHRGR